MSIKDSNVVTTKVRRSKPRLQKTESTIGADLTNFVTFDEARKAAVQRVSTLAKAAFDAIMFMEVAQSHSDEKKPSEECEDLVEKLDETLALMARNLSTYIHIRGKKTQSKELLFYIYGETLGGLESFSTIWERCIVTEDDALSPDSPGFWLLTALSNAVNLFQTECERRPKLFQYWAQEQPYLPMLVFKHKAAYRKRFSRLAESTDLGSRCPINVSPRANYSLETPINARVFDILMNFKHARDWITFARSRDPNIAWRKGATIEDQLAEQAGLLRKLQPVYLAAYDLPPLSKSTAQKWADVYVIPYLEHSGVDLLSEPEFATIRNRKRVKSTATMRAEVRKDVIRSLVGLARPSAPKHRHSSAKT